MVNRGIERNMSEIPLDKLVFAMEKTAATLNTLGVCCRCITKWDGDSRVCIDLNIECEGMPLFEGVISASNENKTFLVSILGYMVQLANSQENN